MAKTVRKDVVEFLELWEKLHNPDFKCLEFEGFKIELEQMTTLSSLELSNLPGIEKK